MPKHSTPKERVEYGLHTISPDRKVTVSLRDLLYVNQTLGEFVQFFHQRMHYPNLQAVEQFLGTRNSGGAIEVLFEAYYKRLRGVLPPDIEDAFGDGERFEHPLPPSYFNTESD